MTAVDPSEFREFFGSIPTAVGVVTTRGPEGQPLGFTCNAFAAVSPDPPLLLACVDRRSRTLPALQRHGAFALHLLAEDGVRVGQIFASRDPDKFAGLGWHPAPAAAGEVPLLENGVLAYAACSLVQSTDAGDHVVLLGRIESVRALPGRPVLYQRGAFRVWESVVERALRS